ncbi:MAG: helicase-related protein, partial [Planctomycetota bacterium]
EYNIAEVHGRLSRDEREAVMQAFRVGESHILVATTVIEVGVDVPNASIMIIEHAERFGLAQLHQLRGRIGRGASSRRPLCVFIADPTTDEAIDRMEAIRSTNDGFKIAEEDLRIRGMGDFFGTRQSGMPPLRVAQIPEDIDLLKLARLDAEKMIDADWQLTAPEHGMLRKVVHQQYGEALGLIDVG